MKNLLCKKPSVTLERNGVRVRGDEYDVARMLAGCILSMKNMGYDTEDLEKALFYITKKDGGSEA